MKEFFGVASLIVVLIGYFPYLRDVLSHKTKPHAFSWLVWSVLSGIAFSVQLLNHAGAGAWLMGLTALLTLTIFLLSLRQGEKNILLVDWMSLLFSGVALIAWFATDRPLVAVILIALIDAIGGFLPTFRKSINKPQEETPILYFLYGLSLCFSLLAIKEFSLVNTLYPASFVVINWFMWSLLLVLRNKSKELIKN